MTRSHTDATHRNRLADESSPYLLQHASNPVDWFPWGEEALDHARREDKPILLSIGYSACHWCHVMAHESFEDADTAAVMNDLFVNIKIDREERPDLDKIYQLAHQMLTQRAGGWPLTMFLSPHDQRPFFGGTYFPDTARHGMPAFSDLLRRVSEFYHSRREDIAQQSAALTEAFRHMLPEAEPSDTALTLDPLAQARERLAADFDSEHGGFGQAPKFPHPSNLDWLLRQWRKSAGSDTPDLHSLYMATLTLNRMAEGGIYDQIGGGFARYSVDQFWMIPHFEKMLYDNGPLLRVYANAAIATGEPLFRDAAIGTAQWITREMQSPAGGYWSSLDADSEGHEGKFYVWDRNEVQTILSEQELKLFSRRFGLEGPPNFEGKWHLHVRLSLDELAKEFAIERSAVESQLESAKHKLLEARNRRVWPGRDEKVLTAWNALSISGMAAAGRLLSRPELITSAFRAIDFIRRHLVHEDRLLAVFKDERARFNAYLDDYAVLLDALLESLQSRWRTEDLQFAVMLADALLEHFEDRDSGGFYFTSDDHESLMHRSKWFADEATPAGNAVAAVSLIRLGYLLGNAHYLHAAERTLRAAWQSLQQHPHAHATMLVALEEHLEPAEIVIIRGTDVEVAEWQSELERIYAPKRLIFAIPNDAADLPEAIASKKANDTVVAYVCRGMVCSEPIRSLPGLASIASGL
jgi:uncharacterized protein YyaL (SSP411 family)